MPTVVQVASWVLLALATVGSAWCAYQAAQWNGDQAEKMAKAGVAQFNSIRKLSVVSRNMTIDVATFLDYMAAESHDDQRRARYLREHARRELKPALESWLAETAVGNADAPTPFARPEYRLAEEEEAKDFEARAVELVGEASQAVATSSLYVLHTVLYALSLMFLGAPGELRRSGVQVAMFVIGALGFAATSVSMSRLPRMKRPDRPHPEKAPRSPIAPSIATHP
jgi:hypothetical protein